MSTVRLSYGGFAWAGARKDCRTVSRCHKLGGVIPHVCGINDIFSRGTLFVCVCIIVSGLDYDDITVPEYSGELRNILEHSSCDITHQLGIYACANEHQTSARSAVVSSPIGQKNQTKKYICLVLNAIETRLGQLHWYCVTWPGALPSTGMRWWSSTTPSTGSWCWRAWLTGERLKMRSFDCNSHETFCSYEQASRKV